MTARNAPPHTHKYLFWLNLGLISTFFAEVLSGSDPFPYFHIWGILMVVPIYLLHTLVLVTIVYRKGRPTLPALYFAGTLFGLYEAYITKILWNPTWGDGVLKLAETAVFETAVLVFFWHVWMSFIFPLLATETWLTGSNQILARFPQRLQRLFSVRRGWLILAVLAGMFVTINTPTPQNALLSGLGVSAVLGFFGGLWRRLTREHSYTIEDLLPNKREFTVLGILLLGIYLLTGLTLRPEAFPPLTGHFAIWILYATCAALLILALRMSRQGIIPEDAPPIQTPPRFWPWGIAIFTLTSALVEAISLFVPLDGIVGGLGWYAITLLGLCCFVRIAWNLLRQSRRWQKPTLALTAMLVLWSVTLACGASAPTATPAAATPVPVEIARVDPAQVTPKGHRILEIDITEGAQDDYEQALQRALEAGAGAVSLSLGWDDIETAPGVYRPDPNWLEVANLYYGGRDLPVSLVISTIDTGVDRRPADLRDRPYDDPETIARFQAMLDYVFTQIPDLELTSLAIGNEIDAALGADAAMWQQYTAFFQATADHARSLRPHLRVGSKAMFPGVTGYAQQHFLALNEHSDLVMVTYYPLDAGFQVQEPSRVEADMGKLASIYPERTIFLAEAGYPSSEVNGSSEEAQSQFIHHLFAAWDAHADQIELVSFAWLTDLSPENVTDFQAYYGVSDKAFCEFLRTLGLRTFDGRDKPAWLRLQAEAEARGW
ncbi:MAG: hypothetical protein ACOYYS_16100 [Chloroflexota bacterium]